MTPEPISPALLREWPLPLPSEGKESRGHVLVVAGVSRTPGAAVLAAEAALRAGAGKLSVATTASTAHVVAHAVPESLVEALPEADGGHLDETCADTVLGMAANADAVLVGAGMLDDEATGRLMSALAASLSTPVVVDATATAWLGSHPQGLARLDGSVVLTVNPSELALVAGCDDDEVAADPAGVASRVSSSCSAVVLLGGTAKHVAAPDGRSWVYEGGSPGLGVSGSGDVQAGIVAGLLARGCDPAQAAVWGGFAHARAGERLAAASGTLGHLAREQPGEVPAVLRELT